MAQEGVKPSDTCRAVPTKATLVLAPSQLLRQWPREVEKFSQKGKLKVVVIGTVADITHLTVKEVQEADVVICATTVLRSPAYFERLARLAGCNRLPDCKSTTSGRQFADSYRKTLGCAREPGGDSLRARAPPPHPRVCAGVRGTSPRMRRS